MKRFLSAAILVLLLAPGAVQAQSQDAMGAAAELVEVMNMEEQMLQGAVIGMEREVARNPQIAPYEDIMRDYIARALQWDDLEADVLRIYATRFSADELRQLSAFYRTPIGQRSVEESTEMAIELQELAEARINAIAPEMQAALMERMAEED